MQENAGLDKKKYFFLVGMKLHSLRIILAYAIIVGWYFLLKNYLVDH